MIYLDNAATSFPKPQSVYSSLFKESRIYSGNPSRSGHILSIRSSEEVFNCRSDIAEMFGADPENVVFTLNATHALNTAIKGVAKPGSHFIISNLEHNAVLRPVVRLSESMQCEYSVANVLFPDKNQVLSEIKANIKRNTRAVVLLHASNICSFRLPVREIGELCRKEGIIFIVDASQSAGHTEINIKDDNINILCAPAHKGLYGCMGLGFLITDGKYEIQTLTEGGSGYNSADIHMPGELPEHLESGTLPLPAICALRHGIAAVKKAGIENIERNERMLFNRMREELERIPSVKIYLPEYQGSCFLFNANGITPSLLGEKLNEYGICVRTGFHCAPLAHRTLGTGEYGAVRCSFGMYTTEREIAAFAYCLKDILSTIKKAE